jgi:hypothetical protein
MRRHPLLLTSLLIMILLAMGGVVTAFDGANESTPFAVQHSPAVNSQATITKAAAGAGVQNVAEGVSFGFSATTALGGITTVTINLRDGATGAGTILKSWNFTLPAAVAAPYTVSLSGCTSRARPTRP